MILLSDLVSVLSLHVALKGLESGCFVLIAGSALKTYFYFVSYVNFILIMYQSYLLHFMFCFTRFFIGTKESTFSFRIQDEREILGFDPTTTFNRLCNDKEKECEQPSQWKIVY